MMYFFAQCGLLARHWGPNSWEDVTGMPRVFFFNGKPNQAPAGPREADLERGGTSKRPFKGKRQILASGPRERGINLQQRFNNMRGPLLYLLGWPSSACNCLLLAADSCCRLLMAAPRYLGVLLPKFFQKGFNDTLSVLTARLKEKVLVLTHTAIIAWTEQKVIYIYMYIYDIDTT